MGLNYLMSKIGKEFDKDGALSSEGDVDNAMLKKLDAALLTSTQAKTITGSARCLKNR
jgi:1,6-anhydro-N-acetylmuramate kinase